MVAEPERELDDGVGRVGVAGGREDARAADVEVRDPVHLAVGVDDALARVGRSSASRTCGGGRRRGCPRPCPGRSIGSASSQSCDLHPPDPLLGIVGAELEHRGLASSGSRSRRAASRSAMRRSPKASVSSASMIRLSRCSDCSAWTAISALHRVVAVALREVHAEAAAVAVEVLAEHPLGQPLGEAGDAAGRCARARWRRTSGGSIVGVTSSEKLRISCCSHEGLGRGVGLLGVRRAPRPRGSAPRSRPGRAR